MSIKINLLSLDFPLDRKNKHYPKSFRAQKGTIQKSALLRISVKYGVPCSKQMRNMFECSFFLFPWGFNKASTCFGNPCKALTWYGFLKWMDQLYPKKVDEAIREREKNGSEKQHQTSHNRAPPQTNGRILNLSGKEITIGDQDTNSQHMYIYIYIYTYSINIYI